MNPGQESASPEVVIALDTVGIANVADTRINPSTEDLQGGFVSTNNSSTATGA